MPATTKFFYGWVIALVCTLITIINGAIIYHFGVFFKPVASDFGWSRSEVAVNYTAMMIAYAPGALLGGRLADRYGPRGVLLLAALFIGFGFIGCSLAPNLVVMILAYVTIGFGLGTTFALPAATVQRWFVRWRGQMVGVVAAGSGIGGLIFAPLTNHLITLYDWRLAYAITGIVFAGVIAVSASFLVSEPQVKGLRPLDSVIHHQGPNSESQHDTVWGITLSQALRLGSFWSMAIIYILAPTSHFFTNSHLVPFVTDRGVSPAIAAQGLGLTAGMTAVGRVIMTWVAVRIGWMKSLATSCFSASMCLVGLAFFVTTPETLYLFAVLYGFFDGSTIALLNGAVGAFFGLRAASELLGFLLGLSVLVAAVAPVLGGLSFDLTSSYLTAIGSAAFLFATAGLLSLLFRPPQRS